MDTKALKVVAGAGVGALLGMGWGYVVRRMTLDKNARTGFVGAREGAVLGALLGAVSTAMPVYFVGNAPTDDRGRAEAWELMNTPQDERRRLGSKASDNAKQWLGYWAARDNALKLGTFSLSVLGVVLAGTYAGSRFGKTDEERTQSARRGELWSLLVAAMVGTWVMVHSTRAETTRSDIYAAAYGGNLGNNAKKPMRRLSNKTA